MTRRTFRFGIALAAIAAAYTLTAGAQAPLSNADAELQYQLGNLLSDETRYREALNAYVHASAAPDRALALRARKGAVKTRLRLAQYGEARRDSETFKTDAPEDIEAITLHADALWSAGLFDEAEQLYKDTIAKEPRSSRARHGLARALGTRNQLEAALKEALTAVGESPRDGEIHALIGELHKRMHHYDEAAAAYTNFINLLPNKDNSEKAAWSRAQVRFLEAFAGRIPVEIDPEAARTLHTVPFRLINDKIVIKARVNGGSPQDFFLDTGSEETVVSRETAQRHGIRPITYTMTAGVGEVGVRGLQLARMDTLDIGTLRVRNLPVLIKDPALRGLPRRERESFSPLSLDMSLVIDYQQQLLTIGDELPAARADFTLPMRVHRLAMVRGVVNSTNPGYFVVDTGGEVISISGDMAEQLRIEQRPGVRRIPLKVYGTSGWDRDAFLLPGQNLDFDDIRYNNIPLVVLNLRVPSILLGFQVGGIVGHQFLSNYRVAMDMARSELRLQKF